GREDRRLEGRCFDERHRTAGPRILRRYPGRPRAQCFGGAGPALLQGAPRPRPAAPRRAQMTTFLRNQWYVAAWDNEVDRTPIARTICGEPVMLYRKFDRSVVAMRDACPHRLLPLSMGIKEGDNIRC